MGRDTLQMTIGPARTAARSITHAKDSVWLAHSYDNEGNRTQTRRSYREVPAYVSTLYSYWVYDRLGRVTSYTPFGSSSSTFTYDVAGNQTLHTTARSHAISSVYDALGRVTRRIVPEVTYGGVHCSVFETQNPYCMFSFPTRGSGVCVPADTARYRYNAAGHMVNADNRWAKIRRDYTPAGLLVADTLRTRTWFVAINSSCEEEDDDHGAYYPLRFTTHVYGLGFEHDLAGRRAKLLHPNSIDPCGGRCEQRYAYGATTGLLDTIVDFSSAAHRFEYDNGGRLTTRYAPGGVADARAYDLDDRLIRRTLSGLVADTLTLDAMGRSRVIRSGYPFAYTSELWYNGLGAVAAADNLTEQSSAEDFTVDALGNRRFTRRPGSRSNGAHKDVDRMRTHEYDSGERLSATRDSLANPADSTTYNYLRQQQHDLSGNLEWRGEKELDVLLSINRYDHLFSYYGADDKLAVANRHLGISAVSDDASTGQRGVWEMHRYDALGRRVATRSIRGSACPQDHTECFSYVERTIWDGDQLLYEIRTPSPTAGGDTPAGGSYNAYGRVLYLHGGGIDAPLAITRMSLNGQPAEVTLAPHADWQGAYIGGTLMDGTVQVSCAPSSGCPSVEWLGGKTTTDGVPVTTAPSTTGWWGSLMQEQVDASGLRYQRNRFYDPSTGQFTQVDPIGLAGGRNLYAFAGGDPVNFDDPFGLCPVCVGYLVLEGASAAYDLYQTYRAYQRSSSEGAEALHYAAVGAILPGPGQGYKAAGSVAGRTFEKAGIEITDHFRNRLQQRGGRGITEAGALDAYRGGRLFYDPGSKNYVRHDSKSGISVVVDRMSGGKAITVFEGNPSAGWQHVRWRP